MSAYDPTRTSIVNRRRPVFGGKADIVRSDGLLNGLLLQERQIERPEHENNSDVHYQPRPEPVPQEQDVHADHDDYQREHVKDDGCLSSHPSLLLRAAGVSTTLF